MLPSLVPLVLLFAHQIHAFPTPQLSFAPRAYRCVRADSPPVIDGQLDEDAWQGAAWSEAFVDIEGELRDKPFRETRMKLLWDDTALYMAAWLEEPQIWATYDLRDMVIYQVTKGGERQHRRAWITGTLRARNSSSSKPPRSARLT